MNYTTFAQLYDELMEPSMYDKWLAFVERQAISKQDTILDLACGTGRLAVMLAQAQYDIAGVDLSAEMLALADMHARKSRVNVPFIEANMLDLHNLAKYATITCFADSLCYLQTKAELQKTFCEVYQHLFADGKFLFDVITPYKTDEVYPGYMYNYTDEKQAFIWSSYADNLPHSVIHDLTFFIYDETNNKYVRLNEEHHERTYSMETYIDLLHIAGFKKISVSADFGQSQPTDKTERLFFVCEK
ncbi:class I SAM-dependent methyltransferase [Ligilactobacillus sp. WILCCON 0076]|uniref:Class I SAM-dependent methyltransferase n=1 Tax=Ligilactobacillus ubinensis TaxID=2876789 RepID=A0A9X2JL83_9LACO|nr:class I SAM-dependent methyltransferase [Ligilactobacillus ubinensis]MCP0886723.1 class I SAM-dependent methyltransferase [Ligilactobacillus ubinensis]